MSESDGRVVVVLREPVRFGSETITELRLRKPKARDVKGMDMREDRVLDFTFALASKLSGQPTQVIDELCMEDFWEVAKLVSDFTGAGQPTGE